MAVDVKIPTAGESITQVRIGEWRRNTGDYVENGEILCEIETDKAAMELPAPTAGVLGKILKPAGADATVGEVIASIDEKAAKPAGASKGKAASAAAGGSGSGSSVGSSSAGTAVAEPPSGGEARVMPAAARVMAEHGLKTGDVQGSGPGGRVLKEDAQRAVEARSSAGSASAPAATATPAGQAGNGRPSGARPEEVVPMTMLRRRIAERLVDAQRNAAILTTFNEVDMSAVMKLREQRQDEFVKRYGIKLGFMSFFVKAAIDALKHFPAVNGEIRGTDIVYKHYYDVGVAVSTERGLVVPVIRNAELLSFAEIEQKIAELAQRARDRKLEVEELQGGTFTISNGGVFGSLMSTPILNPPQSGILGLHAIQERPVARDGQVVIRPMMYVALSYDHRLVDGRESVSFLKRVKDCVEDPARMLIEA